MIDVGERAGFEEVAVPVVDAMKTRLGERFRAFAFFTPHGEKGVGVVPDLNRERREDPSRHTLQLRLFWPDPAWLDFAHGSEAQQAERAAAFADMFMARLSALEAWYEFQLDSSSQQVSEAIDLKFEVIGESPIPGVDGEIV